MLARASSAVGPAAAAVVSARTAGLPIGVGAAAAVEPQMHRARSHRPATAAPPPRFPASDFYPSSYRPPRRCLATSSIRPDRPAAPGANAAQDLSFPSHLSHPTPYDIFRLPRTASPSAIKARYYDLVRKLHPDRLLHAASTPAARRKATSEFKTVLQAYHLLKDAARKELYDRSGTGWDAARGALVGSASGTSYEEWSASLRRHGAPGGSPHGWTRSGWATRGGPDRRYARRHDQYGWQTHAADPFRAGAFYGFDPSFPPRRAAHPPRYTSNATFFAALFLVTWLLAGLQYRRLSAESRRAVERADRAHLDAAKSLEAARTVARSEEGRQRWEAYKRRAREARVIEGIERVHGGAQGGGGGGGGERVGDGEREREREREARWGIGHGGPSGREEAQRRKLAAERRRGGSPPDGQDSSPSPPSSNEPASSPSPLHSTPSSPHPTDTRP